MVRACRDDGWVNDHDYVEGLLAILTGPARRTSRRRRDPAVDGIDRSGGFGTDLRVISVDVQAGPHGDELRVGFRLAVAKVGRLRNVPSTGSVEVAFDAEWRQLSGYDTPALYAPAVARAVERAALLLVEQHADDPGPDEVAVLDGLVSPTELPDRETQWGWLLEGLADEGEVRQVAPDRIEVDIEQPEGPGPAYGPLLTVVLTPEQWEDVLRGEALALGADLYLGELLGPRDPDETFVVFYKGTLCMSTREKLPPIEGHGEERWFADLLAQHGLRKSDLQWRIE